MEKRQRIELAWRIAYAIEFQVWTDCDAYVAMDAARTCEYLADESPSDSVDAELEAMASG